MNSIKNIYEKYSSYCKASEENDLNIKCLNITNVLSFLFKLLKDKDYEIQSTALQYIISFSEKETESMLIEGLNDVNSGVKCHCALGLGI